MPPPHRVVSDNPTTKPTPYTLHPAPSRKLRALLEYDGTDYVGFQVQPGRMTVQGVVEEKLTRLCGEPVKVIGAGRTDAGVHATGQVVGFATSGSIPIERIPIAFNSLPPHDVVLKRVAEAGPEFHPRYSARRRAYRYTILRGEPSALLRRYAWHVTEPLDVTAASEAAKSLLGRHDFTSFCSPRAETENRVRTLSRLDVAECGRLLLIFAEAEAFLHGMVRILVGTLVEVALGRRSVDSLAATLAARRRDAAGRAAPPQGLCLTGVWYPDSSGRLVKM